MREGISAFQKSWSKNDSVLKKKIPPSGAVATIEQNFKL